MNQRSTSYSSSASLSSGGKLQRRSVPGLYLGFYGVIRLATQFLREDAWRAIGPLDVPSLASVFMILFGLGVTGWVLWNGAPMSVAATAVQSEEQVVADSPLQPGRSRQERR